MTESAGPGCFPVELNERGTLLVGNTETRSKARGGFSREKPRGILQFWFSGVDASRGEFRYSDVGRENLSALEFVFQVDAVPVVGATPQIDKSRMS